MGNILIGADHRGFRLKEFLKEELREKGLNVIDLGSEKYDKDDDYVKVGLSLAERVALEKGKGILICNSGVGMSIVANKVKGVRAALCLDVKQAQMAREDNDANILCLAADLASDDDNLEISKTFLKSIFSSEERHLRRIRSIRRYERTKIS
jgi:ribose 5-phosphate isomerase B